MQVDFRKPPHCLKSLVSCEVGDRKYKDRQSGVVMTSGEREDEYYGAVTCDPLTASGEKDTVRHKGPRMARSEKAWGFRSKRER